MIPPVDMNDCLERGARGGDSRTAKWESNILDNPLEKFTMFISIFKVL